jgi:Ser-tRNA(Ala) deacylase AlaX
VDALPEVDRALFKQINLEPDHYIVVTAETVFYAQGGGQPSDTGVIRSASQDQHENSTVEEETSFSVQAVRHSVSSPGVILHLGHFEPDTSHAFTVDQIVHQSIDGEKRHLNSRIHTGGHIVGLAVRHLSKGSGERSAVPDLAHVAELKAQHYPNAAFVEFRGLIDSKHKDAIQAQCDAFVSQALPIKVYWWTEADLREKCAIVPENVAVPVVADGGDGELGLVRAVDIEGAGAYPCGGTHVPDTSVVGKLEVRKISRSKGISKVSYQIR